MHAAHSREDGQFQSLEDHLTGAAKLAEGFAEPFRAGPWARIIAQYHDYGKCSDAFQARVRGKGGKADHSTAGAKAILPYAGLIGAYCVAGHHGYLPEGGSKAASLESDGTLYGRLKKEFSPHERPDPSFALQPAEPLKSMPFEIADGYRLSHFIRMLASCLIDADRLDTENFAKYGGAQRGGYDDIPVLYARLTEYLSAFGAPDRPINQKRAEIQAACLNAAAGAQGLFSLTVPTGGGKTLSSLAFALRHAMEHGLRRVIYVIPYVNIIEQTSDVFGKALGAENIVEHHSNISFPDTEGGDCDAEALRKQLSTENWDAPVIITTNVQFFESLHSSRTSRIRKLHNIAGSVIIFDEAQMLPLPYLLPCVETIAELARNYRCTAVLMSATQPALKPYFPEDLPMREIVEEPDRLNLFFRRTTLRHIGDISEDALIDTLRDYDRALCIVNTRKRAQRVYAALAGENTYHLSTLMYPAHRRAVLKSIRDALDNGKPCLVVATSLVEAGVDMDFPALFREEAGLDSVIQAAGRCNREGRNAPGESVVRIFRVVGEGAGKPPASMAQAIGGLRFAMEKHEDLSSLDAIHSYFSFLYKLRGEGLDQKQIRALASQNLREMSIPFRQIDERFRLIESETYSVIVGTEPEAEALVRRIESGETNRALFRALGAYTVNIYKDHVKALDAAGALRPFGEGFLLTEARQYDARTGLMLDVEWGIGVFA